MARLPELSAMLTTNANLPFIDYDELAVQPHACKPRNREAKSRSDCFFRRRVQPQAYDAGRSIRRKPEHVGEIAVERDENPPALNGCAPHYGVVCAGKTRFRNWHGIVPELAHGFRLTRREVLIQQEFHASARTTSSAASAAAYSNHARKSSAVSCG